MRIASKIRRTPRKTAGRRELFRAISAAPTMATREELTQLAERGR